MVLGGTYKIPVLVHLLDKNFVNDLRMDGEPSVSAVKKLFLCSQGYIYAKKMVYMLTGKPKLEMIW